MKHMERYLAATSGKDRKKADNEDHSSADSHGAVHDQGDALSKKLKKFGLKTPTLDKNIALGLTSHAVVHKNRQSTVSAFSKSGAEFGSFGEEMSIYDEVTVMDEEVVEEEVIEEVMEEEEVVEEEDEDYAWSGSAHTNSQRSRLSQKFPSGQRRSMRSVVSADSSMYEEETVATNAMSSSAPSDHSSSRMSYYDEVTVAEQTVADTVTEEVTVVEGDLDDYENQGEADESNNSDLDSDDGIPDENDEEEEEENEGEGFTLAFKRNSASQARVSDISLDHSTWGQEMDDDFDDDDEHHIPGQGEEGYCSKFKEGNFRSSLVSTNGPMLRMSTTKNAPSASSTMNKKFLPPSNKNNKFLPSNKFSGPPKTAPMSTSSFVPKKKPSANPPRVSIMRQFANQPLPSLKERSARKERGEKKKKKTKSFDGAGEKKELFMFWERKSSGAEGSTPAEAATDPAA